MTFVYLLKERNGFRFLKFPFTPESAKIFSLFL